MEQSPETTFISVCEFEDLRMCFHLNTFIPIDIFFKRGLSTVFKKVYPRESFLSSKNKNRIIENPDNFFIIKDATQKKTNWELLNFNSLWAAKGYKNKKNEIKNNIKNVFLSPEPLGDLLRSFHYFFPIQGQNFEHYCDDELFLNETSLLLEIFSLISTGVTQKDFLQTYVEKRRYNLFGNNSFERHLIQNEICLHEDYISTIKDLVHRSLGRVPLFAQILDFVGEDVQDEAAI